LFDRLDRAHVLNAKAEKGEKFKSLANALWNGLQPKPFRYFRRRRMPSRNDQPTSAAKWEDLSHLGISHGGGAPCEDADVVDGGPYAI